MRGRLNLFTVEDLLLHKPRRYEDRRKFLAIRDLQLKEAATVRGKIIAAGGFEPDTAETVVEKSDADLVAFGRHFVSNPDLPKRIKLALPLNPYDRDTFYTFDARGCTDYPFHEGLATS